DSILAAVTVSMLSRRELMLKELKKGMELYGLADIVTKHPKKCKGLFVMGHQEEVDGNYLFSLMKPQYSAVGSSRRTVEESVMDNFQDFIFSLEDKSQVFDLSPSAVMGWLTGQKHRNLSKKISPIHVRFDHDCLKRNPKHTVCFPLVGACGREITLPVAHMASLDTFKQNFLLAFCKGQAFSKS
ncbi:predicted protein, partial [Nematostella vectensis]